MDCEKKATSGRSCFGCFRKTRVGHRWEGGGSCQRTHSLEPERSEQPINLGSEALTLIKEQHSGDERCSRAFALAFVSHLGRGQTGASAGDRGCFSDGL